MSTFWVVILIVAVVSRRWGGGSGLRRGRRWSRNWSSWTDDGASDADPARIEQLIQTVEQRNSDVELLQARVNELENRLDFTERMLAERRNAEITGG